jgi:uncharacterized protein
MVYYLYSPDGDEPLAFEFDPAKSEANREKHGIDFVEAQRLWRSGRVWRDRSTYLHEDRDIFVGRLHGRWWTAITTMRGMSIRIISVRRSRASEVPENGTEEGHHR